MLFIWDIHITSRFQESILAHLKAYIQEHAQEKNIIFCGDYVYHFSYDRNALLSLYQFFLELVYQGKTVYILAGNHDRLGNSFVFEEAKKAFDIVNSITHDQGKIFFITKPLWQTIEGKEIFFLPFTIHGNDLEIQEKKELPFNIQGTVDILKKSSNKNESFSWLLNEYLRSQIQGKKNILIVHHYYINNTVFPGQKSRFSYKDIAIHESILLQEGIALISGHLHQAFTHNNCLCLGSVWSTTPLEANQTKYLFSYTPTTEEIQATEVTINPYFTLEQWSAAISKEDILDHQDLVRKQSKKNMESPNRNISYKDTETDLKNVSLSIKTDSIDYQRIDEYIATELRQSIKDIKLKKESVELDQLLMDFEISAKNLSTGFADWKDILKSYLQQKHGNEYEKYETKLKELKLL